MKKFSSITKGSSRRTSRNKKIQLIALLFGALVVALLVLPSVVAFFASLVFLPVHSLQTWVEHSQSSLPQYLRDRAALIREMDDLRVQIASQSGERFTVELLMKENEELRTLLGDAEEKRIAAGIIGRPNKLPYDVLVLDKGFEDGIVEGAPVFVGKKTVIGAVKKTFAKTSVVELITSPHFSASVYIFGPNIYTNAEGIGGGQLRVGVPQGIELKEGDLVVLPSAASGIYGSISVVDSVPTRPEQYGYVSPDIPLSSLRLVSVGDTPLEPVSFEEAQAIVAEARTTLFEVPVPEGVLVTTGSSTASSTATSSSAASSSSANPVVP
jgi:cell shape-determining protein MreC